MTKEARSSVDALYGLLGAGQRKEEAWQSCKLRLVGGKRGHWEAGTCLEG